MRGQEVNDLDRKPRLPLLSAQPVDWGLVRELRSPGLRGGWAHSRATARPAQPQRVSEQMEVEDAPHNPGVNL